MEGARSAEMFRRDFKIDLFVCSISLSQYKPFTSNTQGPQWRQRQNHESLYHSAMKLPLLTKTEKPLKK